jgi:2,4-dienoyl-CoA reductase-like NADH-dependent reductase (Old Yellow Enzyme family)
MSHLFSPLTIKGITLKNRIGVSPMCQYSSIDGKATDWHLVHLGSRAVGGAGLVIAEATAVSPEGRITPHDAGLWHDDQIEPLQTITNFIKAHGAIPAVQLAHAGRKASAARPWQGGKHLSDEEGGYEIVGPTTAAFDQSRLWKQPKALDRQGIASIQQAFVSAAQRALAAGYSLLEIHAAHGYLLHSFFSPLVNTRSDDYGGSLAKRARMLLETTRAIRQVWPERLPLAVRLSVTDWTEGGLSLEDSIQMARWLKEEGVDIIDCSSGGAVPASGTSLSGSSMSQIDLAAAIREAAGVMTMAVGNITEAEQAEAIIARGQADVTLLARQFIRDPYWPFHAAKQLGIETKTIMPPQNSFWV